MYNLFDRYGEVEAVELFENTHGVRNGRGKVKFRYLQLPLSLLFNQSHNLYYRPVTILNLIIVVFITRSGPRLLPMSGITGYAGFKHNYSHFQSTNFWLLVQLIRTKTTRIDSFVILVFNVLIINVY